MKNPRAVLMIVISLFLAVGAVVFAGRWVMEQAKVATGKVVVAKSAIELGTKLNPEMFRLAEWPTGSVPTGAFDDPEKVRDRVAKYGLLAGEPILESKLAPVGSAGGLSAVIGEGKRAMTVRVNDVIGVAGFALPGNYVDIVVNTDDENIKAADKNKSISKIVLEHILVLAVAQEASRDESKPKVVSAVTLELTPEQAEKLDLARSVGSLSLVLRNQFDTSPVTTSGSTKNQLLNRKDEPVVVAQATTTQPGVKPVTKKSGVSRKTPKAKPAPAAEPANKVQVRVFSGMGESVQEFDANK
jgi:pilus assembly protein CpaB